MTIAELLPQISSLPHAEKFRLVSVLLKQLANEEGVSLEQVTPKERFKPQDFFGAGKASREEVEQQLENLREGWR